MGKYLKLSMREFTSGTYSFTITTPSDWIISDTVNVYTTQPTITVYNRPAFTTIKQKDGSWSLAPKNKEYKIESTVLLRNSNIIPERKWILKMDLGHVRIY